MQQLYLHIGYPKTGTTAIQEFLHINRSKLLCQGILYPETGIQRLAHHQFPWVCTNDNRRDKKLSETLLLQSLSKELEEQIHCETVVISSEGFIFAMEPNTVRKIFSKFFGKIRLIIYLRQPFRWILSDYNQGVKGWRRLTSTFDEHLNTMLSSRNPPMDYYKLVAKWASEFGWQNIVVRTFDMEKHDLAKGFLNIINASLKENYSTTVRTDSNPSLSKNQLELTRIINTFDLSGNERNWLLSQIRTDTARCHSKKTQTLSDELFYNADEKILKKIDANNKKLLKFFDEHLFDNDFFQTGVPAKSSCRTKQINVEKIKVIIEPLLLNLLKNKPY